MKTGQLRDYALNIAAGSMVRVQANGDYFRVIDADGGTVTVRTDKGDAIQVREGEGARIQPFTEIKFENHDAVERRVVVIVGTGAFESARLTGSVTMLPAGTIVAVGDIAGGGTIPGNPERRQIVMRASVNNTGNLTVAGLPILPGDTFELDVTGAVDIAGTATDVMHVAEVV